MQKVELGAKVAAIITALVAVIVFSVGVSDSRNARQNDQIDIWRKTAIQKAFHNATDNTLTISTMLQELTSKAFKFEGLDIQKDDLTEDKIRMLLSELISSGIIHQVETDTYALSLSPASVDSSDLNRLRERIVKLESALAQTRTQKTFHELGYVSCEKPENFPVPEPETHTEDWLIVAINPYLNSGSTDRRGDGRGNNAIFGVALKVESVSGRKEWKIEYNVLVNVATDNNSAAIWNCYSTAATPDKDSSPSRVKILALRR